MSQPPHLVGVVVPIRSFRDAFTRLTVLLSETERADFARTLADRVRKACRGLAVLVVSSDAEVCAWAREHGLPTREDPGSLSEAAEAGRQYWAERGVPRVAIVHADLPRIASLDPVLNVDAPVVIVPCHRYDGTPVLVIPANEPFCFTYGPASFALHVRAATAANLDITVVLDPDLRTDIDTADDYAALAPTLAILND